MTIDDKKKALLEFCDNHEFCLDCPCENFPKAWCHTKSIKDMSEAEVNQAYNTYVEPYPTTEQIVDKLNQELQFYRWYITKNDLMWDCLNQYEVWKNLS